AYQVSVRFIMVWQLLVYLVLAALAWPLARLFTGEPEVAAYICWFIWIVPLAYGLQGTIILTNSSFNALHQPARALLLSLIRLFVFYVPLAWAGGKLGGVAGLFIGCVVANLCTAAFAYGSFNWLLKRQQQASGQGEI